MLSNHTDRVYCDVEDLQYAVGKLKEASDGCDYDAATAASLEDASKFVTDSAIYTGAAIALQLIATMRLNTAADFMVAFKRFALEEYTPYKKKENDHEGD